MQYIVSFLLLIQSPEFSTGGGLAEEPPRQEFQEPADGPEPTTEKKGVEFEWFPDDPLYLHPLADPRAPYSGSRVQFPLHAEDTIKLENVLGGQFSLFARRDGDAVFGLAFEAAVFSRFDYNRNLDMDAADFRFGFPLAYRSGDLAIKLHVWHLTSHLGDELIEREGRKRLKYAWNAATLSAAWQVNPALRIYAEAEYGFEIDGVNDPWRAQAGFEWVGEVLPVYLAVHAGSFQENDWSVNINVQLGVWIRPDNEPGGFRVGFEYYRGHDPSTQFFSEHAEYLSLGFWFHF